MIEVIRDIDGMKKIREEWVSLYSIDQHSAFQSFEYNYYSVTHHEKLLDIFVITLKSNNKISQIWPCILVNKSLRFINDTHADFCDILGVSDDNSVVEFIKEHKDIKRISFKNLTKSSKVFRLFSDIPSAVILNELNYSEIELSKTDNFPSNFEHFIYRKRRRLRRILNKYDGEIFIVSEWKDYLKYISDVASLERDMVARGVRKPFFLDEISDIIHELIFHHQLKMSVLKVKNKTVAVSFFFENQNIYSFWIDLYNDDQMINLYHNALFIKEMTSKNQAVFNFGRGDYTYKIQNFGPNIFPLYSVNIFKSKLDVFIFRASKNLYNFAREVYKKMKG